MEREFERKECDNERDEELKREKERKKRGTEKRRAVLESSYQQFDFLSV